MTDTKTYVFPESGSCGNNSLDPNLLFSMMNNNGGFGNGNWIWIIFLFFLYGWRGNGMFGNGNEGGLANQINGDYGRSMLMEAINGNGNAINNLATQLNCSVGQVQSAINNVQSSVCNLGNQVGMSTQQVINSINSGNTAIASQLCSCCCDLKQLVTTSNYENQIANLNQTNTLQNAINNVNVGQERGFNSVAYATADQTCQIKQNIDCNTRSILAKLDSIEDSRKDREIASLTAANASLLARAERQAELAPILKSLGDIECKQPATVTLPYSCATAVPTNLVYNTLSAGLFNNGFYNNSLWA